MQKSINLNAIEMSRLLKPLADRLGILFIPNEDPPAGGGEWKLCPFSDFSVLPNKAVEFRACSQDGATLIHEIGHCIFGIDDKDMGLEEWNWHGWEFRVAREFGVFEQMLQEQDSYTVEHPSNKNQMELGTIGGYWQRVYIRDRLQEAKKNGTYFIGFEKTRDKFIPRIAH